MSEFVFVADAASGLNKELRERFEIVDYVRGTITFPDGSNHQQSLDWEEISAEDYYKSMKNGKAIYKTGFASPQAVMDVMTPYLEQGKDILTIVMSSKMSGTYQSYMAAKKELEEQFPGRTVAVIDSLRFSVPIVLMFKLAYDMKQEGKSLEEIVEWLEANKNRVHQMGPLDDLKFLAKVGRVSATKAFFGQMVGVNSLGDYTPDGISKVIGTVKGKKKALTATIEYVKRTIVDPEKQTIVLGHTWKPEDVETLRQMVEEEFHPAEIITVVCEMASGANIGPGMLSVYYLGEPATPELEAEEKIMAEIVTGLK